MLHLYSPTILEQWIEQFYRDHGIYSPSDLTIENLSSTLGIGVTIDPNVTDDVWFDEDYSHVFINSDHSKEKQREVFFHELCHPLRHYGVQLEIEYSPLRELQEIQANQFQLYAAMPWFMVQELEFPIQERDVIHLLAKTFGVTHQLASFRLDQIKRRVYQGKRDQEFVDKFKCQYRTYDPLDPSRWCDERKRLFGQLATQLGIKI